MKKDNLIQIKSYDFSVKIVLACKCLMDERKEFILSKQLMRSGTSIGANVEEAIGGFSKKDFYHKLTISYKEARESLYWIRLLHDTGYLSQEDKSKLIIDCEEILKIIGSILKTLRNEN
jgi:four helix bundle protein